MLVFPNCKINLGLCVTGKRADGYHNIETIFHPVQLLDALEIIGLNGKDGQHPATTFSHSGITIDGEEKDNLCVQAYHLLKKDFPQIPTVNIHLHKAIPLGAGLGGGSADAAFTLSALNEKFSLGLSDQQLITYALQLGSDCPFFIINKPCTATGRGEILEPVNIALKGFNLVLINPGIHVNTGWAFGQLDIPATGIETPAPLLPNLQTTILQPVTHWKNTMLNDFEKPVFKKYPEIGAIKKTLYDNGALFASMSGSGSTVYGIFNNTAQVSFNFPPSYFVRSILL